MTMSCKSLTQSLNISVQLKLVITYKVSNSMDPDKALTEYRPDLGQIVCKGLPADDNVM